MPNKVRSVMWLALATVLLAQVPAVDAAGVKPMRPVGKVSVNDGLIHDAFAFDEKGTRLAHVRSIATGQVQLHVGPPGGKAKVTELARFSSSPDRMLTLGGSWLVLANDGKQHAAIVDPAGRLRREVGPFTSVAVSQKPKAFVFVREEDGAEGHRYTVEALRPDGSQLARRELVVTPGGSIAGTALTFVAFGGNFLQALVNQPGAYNRKADVRGANQAAMYDVLKGKVVSTKLPKDLLSHMEYAQKRAENSAQKEFLRVDDQRKGLEMVLEDERVSRVTLPARFELYDVTSLRQQVLGGRIVFSLLLDPLNPDQVTKGKEGKRAIHFFSVGRGGGAAGVMGEVLLGKDDAYVWSAGGNKVAVLRKKQESGGGTELLVFSK